MTQAQKNIVEFVEGKEGLGIRLYPVQRIILKALYGIALDENSFGFDLSEPIPADHPHFHPDLVDSRGLYKLRVPFSDFRRENWQVMSEADYLRYLHDNGRANIREVVSGQECQEAAVALGRRGGKTLLGEVIAAYESYKLLKRDNLHGYYGIPETNPIQVISVSVDKDQASMTRETVGGFFKRFKIFDQRQAQSTLAHTRFQTPEDIRGTCRYQDDKKEARSSIIVRSRSCRTKGLRGTGNMAVILDELAHFTDNNSKPLGGKVYKALRPSLSAFAPKDKAGRPIGDLESRIFSLSSPALEQGVFDELFQLGMEGQGKFLCIQAPTWEVNLAIPARELEIEHDKDPNSFSREYGAEFAGAN